MLIKPLSSQLLFKELSESSFKERESLEKDYRPKSKVKIPQGKFDQDKLF